MYYVLKIQILFSQYYIYSPGIYEIQNPKQGIIELLDGFRNYLGI